MGLVSHKSQRRNSFPSHNRERSPDTFTISTDDDESYKNGMYEILISVSALIDDYRIGLGFLNGTIRPCRADGGVILGGLLTNATPLSGTAREGYNSQATQLR